MKDRSVESELTIEVIGQQTLVKSKDSVPSLNDAIGPFFPRQMT